MNKLVGTDLSKLLRKQKTNIENTKHQTNVSISSKNTGKIKFAYSPIDFLFAIVVWLLTTILSLGNFVLSLIASTETLVLYIRDFIFKNLFWGRSSSKFVLLRSILLLVGIFGGILFVISHIATFTLKINSYQELKAQARYATLQAHDSVISTVSLETLVQTKGYAYDTKYYYVKSGDTLSSVAAKFNVSVDTIRWANGLKTSMLRIGQKLKIPPGDGVIHKVKKGDTLASIAKKYKAAPQAIMEANFLDGDSSLRIGTEIFVPNGTLPAPPKPKYVATKPSYNSKPAVVQPPGRPYLPPSNHKRFLIWPVEGTGTLTQRYSYRHKAVDIANNSYTRRAYGGHPYILAAASGRVSFVGRVCNAYRCGYAYMIEIDHGNGFTTLYAHLQPGTFLVKKGQYVKQGQRIARMGESGWTYGIHVHFEVSSSGHYPYRRNLVNPLLYIK